MIFAVQKWSVGSYGPYCMFHTESFSCRFLSFFSHLYGGRNIRDSFTSYVAARISHDSRNFFGPKSYFSFLQDNIATIKENDCTFYVVHLTK